MKILTAFIVAQALVSQLLAYGQSSALSNRSTGSFQGFKTDSTPRLGEIKNLKDLELRQSLQKEKRLLHSQDPFELTPSTARELRNYMSMGGDHSGGGYYDQDSSSLLLRISHKLALMIRLSSPGIYSKLSNIVSQEGLANLIENIRLIPEGSQIGGSEFDHGISAEGRPYISALTAFFANYEALAIIEQPNLASQFLFDESIMRKILTEAGYVLGYVGKNRAEKFAHDILYALNNDFIRCAGGEVNNPSQFRPVYILRRPDHIGLQIITHRDDCNNSDEDCFYNTPQKLQSLSYKNSAEILDYQSWAVKNLSADPRPWYVVSENENYIELKWYLEKSVINDILFLDFSGTEVSGKYQVSQSANKGYVNVQGSLKCISSYPEIIP